MTRILLRAHKDPFTTVSAHEALTKNRIGNNTGNLVFSLAAQRLLSVEGVDIDARRLTGLTAEQVNEEYDALVIPLANAFRVSFRHQLDELSALIEKLTIPVTILGVGIQAPLGKGARPSSVIDESVQRFVAAVLDRSASIGVRGGATARYLDELGFGEPHIQVIGCPSMFMRGGSLTVAKRAESLDRLSPIALNLSPYEHTAALGRLSMDGAEQFPNLMYVAQDHVTLGLLVTGEYRTRFTLDPDLPVHLDHPLVAQNRVRMFLDPQPWFDFLSGCDFTLGTRIHGNITSLQAGTPALVLAHDTRTLELAEYHRIPHLTLEQSAGQSIARLYDLTDLEPLLSAHPERWERFRAYLEVQQLAHIFQEGRDRGAAFDSRLAAMTYPPAVQAISGLPLRDLYAMRQENGGLRREVRGLRKQLRQAAPTPPTALHALAAVVKRRLRRGGGDGNPAAGAAS